MNQRFPSVFCVWGFATVSLPSFPCGHSCMTEVTYSGHRWLPCFFILCSYILHILCMHDCVWKPEVSPGCRHLGSVHLSCYKLLLLLCVCARTRSTAQKWRSEDNFAKSDLSFHLLMSSGDPVQADVIAKQTPLLLHHLSPWCPHLLSWTSYLP